MKQNLRDSGKPAQLTGACRSTDSRTTLGIAYPMLNGSSGLPLPPPSLAGTGQLRRLVHVARWQTTRHYPRCFHSSCLTARRRKPHIRPSTLGPESHPGKASLSGTKDGFFCTKRKRSSPCGRMLGPSRLSFLRSIGSVSRRKRNSSPNGPYLLGNFH